MGSALPPHVHAKKRAFRPFVHFFDFQYQANCRPRFCPRDISCSFTICQSLSIPIVSPLGAIIRLPLIFQPLQTADIVSRCIPPLISISRLHSGGIVFPLSHSVTVLTLLKQTSAAFSLLNPHVNHLKIWFSCIFFFFIS